MRNSRGLIWITASLCTLFSCEEAPLISAKDNTKNGLNTISNTTGTFGPPVGRGYELLFEDEFNGNSCGCNWYPRVDSTYANGKSRNRAENVKITNGMVEISYRQISNNPVVHTGGGLISRQTFGYGYYEARMKFFKESRGFHQSFWSLGAGVSSFTRNMFEAGLLPRFNTVIEIDGVEFDSKPGSQLEANNLTYIPIRRSQGARRMGQPVNEWTVIGYEWLPGKIKYYVDGVLRDSINLVGDFNVYAPQNIWITGLATPTYVSPETYYWDFGGHEPLINPDAKMQVSYVKYWAKRSVGLNLIGNNSFEYVQQVNPTTTRGLDDPIAWIEPFAPFQPGFNRDASKVEVSTDAKEGNNRLVHQATTPYITATKQTLNEIPNGLYKLTAWVKSSSHMIPSNMSCAGYGHTERFVNIPTSNDWVQITIDNINVTTNQVVISFNSNAQANEWIYVDDVQFVAK
jgi:hypothetical protein